MACARVPRRTAPHSASRCAPIRSCYSRGYLLLVRSMACLTTRLARLDDDDSHRLDVAQGESASGQLLTGASTSVLLLVFLEFLDRLDESLESLSVDSRV